MEFLLPVICKFECESELTVTLDRPVHRSLLAGKSCEASNSRVQSSLLAQARVAEADAMQKV